MPRPQKTFFYITDSDQFDDLGSGSGQVPEEGWWWLNTSENAVKRKVNGAVQILMDAGGIRIKQQAITKTYLDFAGAFLMKQITLLSLPSKGEILSINQSCTTAWDVVLTATSSVGTAQAPTDLLTAQDIKTTGIKDTLGNKLKNNRGMYSVSAPTSIVAEVVATGFNLNQATQGSITYYITWVEYA